MLGTGRVMSLMVMTAVRGFFAEQLGEPGRADRFFQGVADGFAGLLQHFAMTATGERCALLALLLRCPCDRTADRTGRFMLFMTDSVRAALGRVRQIQPIRSANSDSIVRHRVRRGAHREERPYAIAGNVHRSVGGVPRHVEPDQVFVILERGGTAERR